MTYDVIRFVMHFVPDNILCFTWYSCCCRQARASSVEVKSVLTSSAGHEKDCCILVDNAIEKKEEI